MTRVIALTAATLTLASCGSPQTATQVTPHAWPRSVPAGVFGNVGVFCVEDNPCAAIR